MFIEEQNIGLNVNNFDKKVTDCQWKIFDFLISQIIASCSQIVKYMRNATYEDIFAG